MCAKFHQSKKTSQACCQIVFIDALPQLFVYNKHSYYMAMWLEARLNDASASV